MNLLNKIGYNPIDDDSISGYRRPPKHPPSVCDYFAALGTIEDGGVFMHNEMKEMLDRPEEFFEPINKVPKFCPMCGSNLLIIDIVEEGWGAKSLDPMDEDNTAELAEHQCQTCGISFWTGRDS